MMASLDRHLKNENYKFSIARDSLFKSSREVLEGLVRQLRQEGKGKVPNRSRSLTSDEENILWDCGQLGATTSRTLIQTMWWHNCLYFGMRSREEHYNINITDFEKKIDKDGRKYITFQEGLTKTRNAGLNFKPRLIFPKMYATGGPRCPYLLFETYVNHRPEELKYSGSFYLAVIDFPLTNIWYKKMKMGVNTIHCKYNGQEYETKITFINNSKR